MNDEQIKRVLLAHGFAIQPGRDDFAPYVYAAAHSLLAVQAHHFLAMAAPLHQVCLVVMGTLADGDPTPDSDRGRVLMKMADAVERYERATLPAPFGDRQ